MQIPFHDSKWLVKRYFVPLWKNSCPMLSHVCRICGFSQLYATCRMFSPRIPEWNRSCTYINGGLEGLIIQLPPCSCKVPDMMTCWSVGNSSWFILRGPHPNQKSLCWVRSESWWNVCVCVGPFLSTVAIVASDVGTMAIASLDPPSDPCLFWMRAYIQTIKNDHPGLCVDDW